MNQTTLLRNMALSNQIVNNPKDKKKEYGFSFHNGWKQKSDVFFSDSSLTVLLFCIFNVINQEKEDNVD